LVEGFDPSLYALFLLGDPLLDRRELTTLVPRFAFRVCFGLRQQVAHLQLRLLANRVAFLPRLLDDACRRLLGAALEVLDAAAPGHINDPEESEPETQPKGEEE
jgi:hypothetical protein